MLRGFVTLAAVGCLAVPVHSALSQIGVSLGGGIGIAGSTDASLSNGTTGWIVAGEVTTSLLPVIKLGAEVDHLHHTAANATFATAILEIEPPLFPLFFKAGAGYGRAEVSDPTGTASGLALQLGAGYRVGIPIIPIGVALFANAYFAHSASRSAQMVDGGLAIRF